MTSTVSTVEAIEKAMEGVTPGLWDFDGPKDSIIVWSGPDMRICFMTSDGNAEANAAYIAACSPDRMREVLAIARKAEALERENAELTRATQESLVAMRIAACLPNVAAEYDFSDALGYCERALAPHARTPRRI